MTSLPPPPQLDEKRCKANGLVLGGGKMVRPVRHSLIEILAARRPIGAPHLHPINDRLQVEGGSVLGPLEDGRRRDGHHLLNCV